MWRLKLRSAERGTVATVMLLLYITLFVAGIALITELPRAVYGADAVLAKAVERAARAASMMVDPAAQASGSPVILPPSAHKAFRAVLAWNLKLDENTLEPLPGSVLAGAPSYVLLVYNGANSFAETGVRFCFSGGQYSEGALEDQGLPAKFSVGESAIEPGTGGLTVTLPSPGSIAVVRAPVKNVLGGSTDAVRWAAARIVVK